MRREHMNRNPIEMSVIPVSNDIMVCFKCYPVRIISYPIQWLSDINSTSSYAKVKEFSQVRGFFLGGGGLMYLCKILLYVCHREKLKNGVSGVGVKKEFIMHALHLWYADYGKRCYISMFQKRSGFLSVTE